MYYKALISLRSSGFMKSTWLTTTVIIAAAILVGSAIVFNPAGRAAYAHNFSGDESATFLSKIEGLKVETNLISKDVSNSTLVKWHLDKIGEFWSANDTKEVAERNQRVANDISTGLKNLLSQANMTNPDAKAVNQTASGLLDTYGEVVSVRIDAKQLQNATVNALALRGVLDETLEDYGIAAGASDEGSTGNNTTTSSSAAGNATESTTGPVKIVNMAAYQTSQGLAASAINMFGKLKTMSPGNDTSAVNNIEKGMADLQKAIADKAPVDNAKKIVDETIDSNLQTAFKLQVVPEFPMPVLLSMGAIAAVVAITRYAKRSRSK
jgi:hypothetical protein